MYKMTAKKKQQDSNRYIAKEAVKGKGVTVKTTKKQREILKKLQQENWTPEKVKQFNEMKVTKPVEDGVVKALKQVKKSIKNKHESALDQWNSQLVEQYNEGLTVAIAIIDRKLKSIEKR